MCSISTNKTVDSQLTSLEQSADRNMIEKRLFQMADSADITHPGGLENPALILKHMEGIFSGLKHLRVGRHRIYFMGHHTQCSYQAFYIKENKKSDKDTEGSKRFQRKLENAWADPQGRTIQETDFT